MHVATEIVEAVWQPELDKFNKLPAKQRYRLIRMDYPEAIRDHGAFEAHINMKILKPVFYGVFLQALVTEIIRDNPKDESTFAYQQRQAILQGLAPYLGVERNNANASNLLAADWRINHLNGKQLGEFIAHYRDVLKGHRHSPLHQAVARACHQTLRTLRDPTNTATALEKWRNTVMEECCRPVYGTPLPPQSPKPWLALEQEPAGMSWLMLAATSVLMAAVLYNIFTITQAVTRACLNR